MVQSRNSTAHSNYMECTMCMVWHTLTSAAAPLPFCTSPSACPGSAGVSSGSLRALLADKQVRHDLLLTAYQAGGVLQQLPAQQSRRLFEHAEVLAAVAAVLDWQRQQEAAAGDTQSGGAAGLVVVLHRVQMASLPVA
jgi:hypothetical protein